MKKPLTPAERIMVALDVDELAEATDIIQSLSGFPVTFKVGNQLGTFEGWQKVIHEVHKIGARIFCDTKFKDIPATVERSCRAITRHQPDFFNIMVDNSISAIEGAIRGRDIAIEEFNLNKKPILLGVTVLTSMSDSESVEIYGAESATRVVEFATRAAGAGLEGVVCSPKEATLLKNNPSTSSLLLVTPGIRPSWAASGDQTRILTPADAVRAGSDYLVIGRPITRPPQEVGGPRQALERILQELEEL